MHQDIIKYYRKDNPLFDIKIIDKDELISGVYPNVKKTALLYLMSEYHYSYDISETYLEYVPYVNSGSTKKINDLLTLKKELEMKGYLYPNEPIKLLFSNKTATVFGYDKDDKELNHLAKELNLSLEFFVFKETAKAIETYQFDRFEDEIYFVLNEIAHLLDNGVSFNDIIIIRRNNEYDYYLEKFSPYFGFHLNLDSSTSWFETGVFVEFDRLYEECQDVEIALEQLKEICKEDDLYPEFVKVVNKIVQPELDYEVQRALLLHQLKLAKIINDKYYPAIKVIANPSFYENKYVYILGFCQGVFPKTNKDDAYLSNDELDSLYLLNAIELTKFDQVNIINFFKQSNHVTLTYSLKSLKEKRCYASPILKDLDLKPKSNPFRDYFYSKKVLDLIYSDLCDLSKFYDERGDKYYQIHAISEIPYNTYDNSYKGVNKYSEASELVLSSSQINNYFGCPFKYYLNKVLKVDPFQESDDTILGNILHELLEHGLLDESYDIEGQYLEKVDASNASDETKFIWKFSLKEQVVKMVGFLRKHNQYMKSPQFKFEETINAKLDEKTTVTGRIDKLVILDNKYIVAIDYKTGTSGDFAPDQLKYGKSSQLPTYAYLFQNSVEYHSYKISGLYINHLINTKNNMTVKEGALIPEHLALIGKSLIDLEAFSCFDSTIADGKSSFVRSVVFKNGGLAPAGKAKSVASEEEFAGYIEEVKNKYLEAAECIRNNQFEIHPLKNGTKEECEHCTYKDICYVRHYQMNEIKKEEKDDE